MHHLPHAMQDNAQTFSHLSSTEQYRTLDGLELALELDMTTARLHHTSEVKHETKGHALIQHLAAHFTWDLLPPVYALQEHCLLRLPQQSENFQEMRGQACASSCWQEEYSIVLCTRPSEKGSASERSKVILGDARCREVMQTCKVAAVEQQNFLFFRATASGQARTMIHYGDLLFSEYGRFFLFLLKLQFFFLCEGWGLFSKQALCGKMKLLIVSVRKWSGQNLERVVLLKLQEQIFS